MVGTDQLQIPGVYTHPLTVCSDTKNYQLPEICNLLQRGAVASNVLHAGRNFVAGKFVVVVSDWACRTRWLYGDCLTT